MSKKSKSTQQPRKRRRRREERGLPSDKALRELAKTYLENQHRLWPELVEQGELREITDEVVGGMAALYKEKFLGKHVESFVPVGKSCPWENLAATYLRYSDANSNPRSLDQQLRLQLERAKQHGYFVPWVYVFCDAAVTGTTAARGGYELAKESLRNVECGIVVLLIDEVGRASRDMIEALSLGRLIEQLGKRLIGVSDGFDTEIAMWKTVLSMFAALQEMFVDQLRAKVNRGMEDAFRRGTNTGLPALGYSLEPATDTGGNALFGKDGERVNMLVIDQETAQWVEKAFELYAIRKWTLTDIGRHFNVHCVGGLQTWDGSRIRQLLSRRTYVGILVYRTKRQKIDPDTGNVITERRPRSEWLVRRAQHLRIVSWKRWKDARKRLAESREAYSQKCNGNKSRIQIHPKILVRPICGVCGDHLWLGRSGKYASLTCLNGKHGKHGCTFKGYKSVKIIETAILGFLKENVFTEERIKQLVAKANEYLAEEAAKPKADVAPLKAEIKKVKAQRNRLAKILDEQGTSDLNTLVDRLRAHERRLTTLNRQLRDIEASNNVPPQIERDDVDRSLRDLRGLLNQDVAQAAPVINELLGPVIVRQEQEEGKSRSTWIAEFTVNLVRVIAKLDSTKNCPSMDSWEYLETRSWTIQETEGVWLGTVPTYERIATAAIEMANRGGSVVTIASALNTSWVTVQDALVFARTGKRPGKKPTGKKTRKRSGPPKYIAIREEVLRRHGVEKEPFHRIARDLGVSEDTVRRSWDSTHREEVQAAVSEGRSPNRGRYRHLAADKIKRMREMILMADGTSREIAVAVGVSTNTVQRERKRMLTDAASS